MTDRTGGPGTPNFVHRERPEQWDEEEEIPSDGEHADVDGRALRVRSAGSDHPPDEEESRIARQDLPFARRLTQRAEALEKVVTGMLEQPPRDYPFPEDEPITPVISLNRPPCISLTQNLPRQTPPQQRPPVGPPSVGKHVLPNGVRLRLALTTIINDMFAREAPSHRLSHAQAATSSSSGSRRDSGASTERLMMQTSSPSSSSSPSPSPLSWLPQSLVPLLFVSSAAATANSAPFPYSVCLLLLCLFPLLTCDTLLIQPSNLTYPFLRHQPFNTEPTPRACDMFTAGVDLGSSPFLRCPRHLHQACGICVDSGRGAPARPRGGCRASERTSVAQGGGISGFAEGAGVGGGLARPVFGGTLLRRSVPPVDEARMTGSDAGAGTGGGNARLAELIPRFLRLSALVALELGREVGAEEISHSGRIALAPTAHWYLLLAGLLTRALLEGYLTAGWTGLAPVQILLGVGLRSAATSDTTTMPLPPAAAAEDDEYVEFEPDGMPDLTDAVDVLFPSRSTNADAGGGVRYENSGGGGEGSGSGRSGGSGGAKGGGEAEYAREMGQRLARVCTLLLFHNAARLSPFIPLALYAYALPFLDWRFVVSPEWMKNWSGFSLITYPP
jgi:hypothetical protein